MTKVMTEQTAKLSVDELKKEAEELQKANRLLEEHYRLQRLINEERKRTLKLERKAAKLERDYESCKTTRNAAVGIGAVSIAALAMSFLSD